MSEIGEEQEIGVDTSYFEQVQPSTEETSTENKEDTKPTENSDNKQENQEEEGNFVDTAEFEKEPEVKTPGDNEGSEENKETNTEINTEDNNEESENNEETNTEADNITPKTEGPPSSPYSSLTSALQEQGVLNNLSDEDKAKIEKGLTSDDFFALMNKEVETRVKSSEYSDLTPFQVEILEAARNGIPMEMFTKSKYAENYYDNLTSVDLEDENTRKELIINEQLVRGVSEAKATEYAEDQVELGKDETAAKDAVTFLKNFEKERLTKEAEKQAGIKEKTEKSREENLEKVKEKIYKSEELIKGVKLKETDRDAIYNTMTKVVSQKEDGTPLNALQAEQLKDPNGFNVRLFHAFNLTNGFKDFDKFITNAKTKSVQQLEKDLKTGDTVFTGSSPVQNNDNNTKSKSSANGLSGALEYMTEQNK